MDKRELISAAEQLATAELVCHGMRLIADGARKEYESYQPRSVFEGKKEQKRLELAWQDAQAQYEHAAAEVDGLTRRVNDLRTRSEDVSGKRYWWDVPFLPEEPTEPEGYHFDGGTYIEQEALTTELQGGVSLLGHKPTYLNYTLLSMTLTASDRFPLYLDKKQLRHHINDEMTIRHIYNVMSVTGSYQVVSYMNPNENPAAAIRRAYEAQADARRAEYDEYLRKHEETWDHREKIRHDSLFTNEERWFAGQMSSEDYLRESLWRDYGTWNKQDRLKDDLTQLRLRSEQAQREARKNFVKSRKDAVYETNLIRLMRVADVIYCKDKLMGILLYTAPQSVTEYDCAPEVDPDEMTGQYHVRRELFRKKPALIPLVRHIAVAYSDLLPDYRVLKPCPQGCPDYLWRVWAEIRWAMRCLIQISN